MRRPSVLLLLVALLAVLFSGGCVHRSADALALVSDTTPSDAPAAGADTLARETAPPSADAAEHASPPGAGASLADIRIPPGQGIQGSRVLAALWGERAPDPSLHLGLWALHLERPDWGVTQHSLVGGTWRGFFGGTFVNTYGDRSFAAGMRRVVWGGEAPGSRLNLGYRLGLVSGYDERLVPLAGRLPAIPAFELVGGARVKSVGLHWSWAGVVTQVGTVWYWPVRKR